MSSLPELGTTSRSPAAVRQYATSVGRMPTSMRILLLEVARIEHGDPVVIPAGHEQPFARRIQRQAERPARDLRPPCHGERGDVGLGDLVLVIQGDEQRLPIRGNRDSVGRVMVRTGFRPWQRVQAASVAMDAGDKGEMGQARHPAFVGRASKCPPVGAPPPPAPAAPQAE